MLAPALASLQGPERHTKPALWGASEQTEPRGRRQSQRWLPSVHDTSLNPSGLAGLQKQHGHGHLPEPKKITQGLR